MNLEGRQTDERLNSATVSSGDLVDFCGTFFLILKRAGRADMLSATSPSRSFVTAGFQQDTVDKLINASTMVQECDE